MISNYSLKRFMTGLSLLCVFSLFTYDSITAKAYSSKTSTISVAILLLPMSIILISRQSIAFLVSSIADVYPLMFLMFVYIVMGSYSYIDDHDMAWIRESIYILMIAVSFIIGRNLDLSEIPSGVISIFMATLIATATFWVIKFNEGSAYGFASTKNVVGGLLVHFVYFVAFIRPNRRYYLLASAVVAVIAIITSQRALIPASLFGAAVYILIRRKGLGQTSRAIVMLACVSFGCAFVYFISNLNYNPDLYKLNSLSIEYTGRRLNSGREELWHTIFIYLQDHIWLGLGTGVTPGDIFSTPLSSHNSFLQVILQVGIVGLIAVIWQLWRLLGLMVNGQKAEVSAAATGYFVLTFVHAMTETFLVNNSFLIASAVWINFGLLSRMTSSGSPDLSP